MANDETSQENYQKLLGLEKNNLEEKINEFRTPFEKKVEEIFDYAM